MKQKRRNRHDKHQRTESPGKIRREALLDFLTRQAQLLPSFSFSEKDMAQLLDKGYTSVADWNEAVSQTYRIDPAEAYSAEEIRAHYNNALQEFRQAGDVTGFVKLYASASISPSLGGQPLMSRRSCCTSLCRTRTTRRW